MTKDNAKRVMRALVKDLSVTCMPHEAVRYLLHLGVTETELKQDFGYAEKDIQVGKAMSHAPANPTVAIAWWPRAGE